MADNIPEPEIVTLELLQKAIRLKQGNDDISVKKFSILPGSKKSENFLCVILAARVTVQHSQEEQDVYLILKTPPRNAYMKQWVLRGSKAFYKEVMVYKELIPDMIKYQERNGIQAFGPSVPSHYYSEVDDNDGIVVLEDLHHLLYSTTDMYKGLGYEHCSLVMKELGIFHALSWAMKNGNPDNLKKYTYIFRDTLFEERAPQFFIGGIATCVKLIKMCADDAEIRTRVQKLAEMDLYDTMKKLLKPVEPYAVICHGDAWCNNMLFRNKNDSKDITPTAVKLLDLQIVRYAPPSTDLAFFFYTSTTREIRKKHLTVLLRLYYSSFMDCLAKFGMKFPEFTFEALEQQFAEKAIFGMLLAFAILPVWISKPEDGPDFTKLSSAKEMEDYRKEHSARFLESGSNSVLIKERLTGIVQDAIEMDII